MADPDPWNPYYLPGSGSVKKIGWIRIPILNDYFHTNKAWDMIVFYHVLKIFLVLIRFLPGSISVLFLLGSGSITNYFTSWIRIRIKIIRIRHTAEPGQSDDSG